MQNINSIIKQVTCFLVLNYSFSSLHAQIKGSILSPTHTIGGLYLSSEHFDNLAVGLYGGATMSFAQFFSKKEKTKGLIFRDIWGVRCGLGGMKKNTQSTNKRNDGFWGMIALDYAGIQALYGVGKNTWVSTKIYQSGVINNAFTTDAAIHGLIVTAGVQLDKIGVEFIKGFEQKIFNDHWKQSGIGISYNYKKNKFFGLRIEKAKYTIYRDYSFQINMGMGL